MYITILCNYRHIRTLKAQNEEDEEELQTLQADRSTFLTTAIHNYLKCLEAGVSKPLFLIIYHKVFIITNAILFYYYVG